MRTSTYALPMPPGESVRGRAVSPLDNYVKLVTHPGLFMRACKTETEASPFFVRPPCCESNTNCCTEFQQLAKDHRTDLHQLALFQRFTIGAGIAFHNLEFQRDRTTRLRLFEKLRIERSTRRVQENVMKPNPAQSPALFDKLRRFVIGSVKER